MTEKKVWLITGAGRGLGVDIARAALAAGRDAAANKSLNRSGGSTSRIKLDPAKVLRFAPPG